MLERRNHPMVFVRQSDGNELGEAENRHLRKSLRLKTGDHFIVSTGFGEWRMAALTADGYEHISEAKFEAAPLVKKTVAFTPVKGDRSGWVVQKLTELNIDQIVLLETDRSVVRWDAERRDKQVAKLKRVAIEACGQSRRVRFPEIQFQSLSDVLLLPGAVMAEPGGRKIAEGDCVVAIGPEGGWSERETELGAHVQLPGGILRAETAALAAAVQIGACTAPYS